MSAIYHIRIKKEYAESVLEDLHKMKAVELVKEEEEVIPDWQKKEVRKRVKEMRKDPSILIDESAVNNMLNRQ
jgi:hypothetical protein